MIAVAIALAPVLGLILASPANAGSATRPCEGIVIESRPGSELDGGWTGVLHNRPWPSGVSTSWEVMKRCTNDQQPCVSDDDCGAGDCVETCDCVGDATCEITGPVHGRKCLTTLEDCTTNADCPASVACVHLYGHPIPIFAGTNPYCALMHFEGGATGTFHATSGAASLSATLRLRLFLGSSPVFPCPRCGAPEQDPGIGDTFTCEGGQFPGAVCTVEGVSERFGGTSSACPPATSSAVGSPLAIRFNDLTTAEVTKTARLQCGASVVQPNPLSPATNPKCTDDLEGSVCTSNADCTRCTGDSSIKCTSNGDCTGNGTCAAAPNQPVTCGYWCHCGYCNGNASLPCFESSECPEGQACVKGSSTTTAANGSQLRPNACTGDAFLCGEAEEERCEDTLVGSCSLQSDQSCNSNTDCMDVAAGTCVFAGKSCFEPRITRSGAASTVGKYCAYEDKTCSSNADCTSESGDFCATDSSRPRMVALFCAPNTSFTSANNSLGIAGPAAASFESFIQICRCGGDEIACGDVCGDVPTTTTTTLPGLCGNGAVAPPEECDDGNTMWVPGEHCNAQCKFVACGDPNDSKTITTSDALFTLRSSVGTATCALQVCDANGNGTITTTDALAILRKSVGQGVVLNCG